jgi:hypothetical protein
MSQISLFCEISMDPLEPLGGKKFPQKVEVGRLKTKKAVILQLFGLMLTVRQRYLLVKYLTVFQVGNF